MTTLFSLSTSSFCACSISLERSFQDLSLKCLHAAFDVLWRPYEAYYSRLQPLHPNLPARFSTVPTSSTRLPARSVDLQGTSRPCPPPSLSRGTPGALTLTFSSSVYRSRALGSPWLAGNPRLPQWAASTGGVGNCHCDLCSPSATLGRLGCLIRLWCTSGVPKAFLTPFSAYTSNTPLGCTSATRRASPSPDTPSPPSRLCLFCLGVPVASQS